MQDSVFTKILNKEIPGEVIYEDDVCFAILSIEPHNPGHLLLIPRVQVADWQELARKQWLHMMGVAQDLAEVVKKVYQAPKVALSIVGLEVPHVHVHIFSIFEVSDIDHSKAKKVDLSEIKLNAQKLRVALRKSGINNE